MLEPTMTPERARWLAQCFVCGTRRHGKTGDMQVANGEFSARFMPHPWVREAITEGWGNELRSFVTLVAQRRVMAGQPLDIIEDLMPPRKWVDDAKVEAARRATALEWQRENRPENVVLHALLSSIAKRAGINP
jgi:hypothetical protein